MSLLSQTSKFSTHMGNARNKFLESFTSSTPLPFQVVIGLGAMLVRPLIILSNKAEEPTKRIYAATRVCVQEVIALPLSIGLGFAAGKIGARLAKGTAFAKPIGGITTTAGFAAANLIIPPLTTMSITKFSIKEKVKALTLKKDDKKDAAVKPNNIKNHRKLDVTTAFLEFKTTPKPAARKIFNSEKSYYVNTHNSVKKLAI